jgi:hypothetical protein
MGVVTFSQNVIQPGRLATGRLHTFQDKLKVGGHLERFQREVYRLEVGASAAILILLSAPA